jgi:hypothetical protein
MFNTDGLKKPKTSTSNVHKAKPLKLAQLLGQRGGVLTFFVVSICAILLIIDSGNTCRSDVVVFSRVYGSINYMVVLKTT